MSDTSQGPGCWLASAGKWYPPGTHPGHRPRPSPAPATPAAPAPAVVHVQPPQKLFSAQPRAFVFGLPA